MYWELSSNLSVSAIGQELGICSKQAQRNVAVALSMLNFLSRNTESDLVECCSDNTMVLLSKITEVVKSMQIKFSTKISTNISY